MRAHADPFPEPTDPMLDRLAAASLPLCLCASPAAGQTYERLTLYQPTNDTTTLLVDPAGAVVRQWPGVATPGMAAYLLPDGDLLRAVRLASGAPGSGGGLERLSWDGALEWQVSLVTADLLPHHDVEALPNGNVLVIAWRFLSALEAIGLGRDPALVSGVLAPDEILEVQPTGPSSAQVVWRWRAQDHLIQDFDPTRPGFGVVADHPERIDVNYPPVNPGSSGDWLHMNGIDYDAELDQIVVSVPRFDEVWVIDHSTTTAEAAGSTGGASGRGGDLLYRWGNPLAYGRGTVADQRLFTVHDVQWIDPGLPGAGNLLLFNNGTDRPGGPYSSVDELAPPLDGQGGYVLPQGGTYGPTALAWTYEDPGTFFSPIMSGAERLASGDTLVAQGAAGRIFVVDPTGQILWEHVAGAAVFKARSVADCTRQEVFCAGAPNSVGAGSRIGFTGSVDVSADDLVLTATGNPPGQFGLFFYGAERAQVPFGEGTRCVATPVVRLLPPVRCDAGGVATAAVDQDALPAAGTLAPFSTRHFQFWYRDPAGGPSGWNLSDGLTLTFCP